MTPRGGHPNIGCALCPAPHDSMTHRTNTFVSPEWERSRHVGPAIVQGTDPRSPLAKIALLDHATESRTRQERVEAEQVLADGLTVTLWTRRTGTVTVGSLAEWDAVVGVIRSVRVWACQGATLPRQGTSACHCAKPANGI